jgi:DNA-binding MarR family transcriptional regulator
MSSLAPSALEDHLGFWLRTVSNEVSRAFSVKLAAHDIAVAEWVMLRELYGRDAMIPSLLAERMGMTRGGISKLSDRLLAKGFVSASANDTDRRSHALSLTARGKKLVPQLAALADANDAEFFGHLKPGEVARLDATLREIVRRFDLRTLPTE